MGGFPYNTQRWKRLRLSKLQAQPLCEQCRQDGITTPANVVDHVQPIRHGGDPFPALDGLASLCASCHGAKTARGIEAGAVRTSRPRRGCTPDGRPIDSSHPWNREKSLRAEPLDTDVIPSHSISFVSGPGLG